MDLSLFKTYKFEIFMTFSKKLALAIMLSCIATTSQVSSIEQRDSEYYTYDKFLEYANNEYLACDSHYVDEPTQEVLMTYLSRINRSATALREILTERIFGTAEPENARSLINADGSPWTIAQLTEGLALAESTINQILALDKSTTNQTPALGNAWDNV